MEPTLVKTISTLTTRYGKYTNVNLWKSAYMDNSGTALFIETQDGEHLFTVTVNVKPYGLQLSDDNNVFVKDYSENEGVLEALVKDGVLEKVRSVPEGFVTFEECKILV